MFNVTLEIVKITALIFVTLPILCGCEISTEDKKESPVGFVGHCSKYLKVHKPATKSIDKADVVDKGSVLGTDEKLLYAAYSIVENSDGSHNIQCWLSDGAREYKNETYIKPGRIMDHNYCDIVYDLDQPSFGTFTFEYSGDWNWIHYNDEETGYTFDRKFRNSECIEF